MFEFLVIIFCLLINALLSCVEMAFVTVSKPYLRKLAGDGDKLATRLIALRKNPERILSVLQVGITLVGAISAAVSGLLAEEALAPILQANYSLTEDVADPVAIGLVVIPLTYFSVVIGELVPKTLALKFPLKFAKFGALFLPTMARVFAPLVFLLEISTKILISPFIHKMGKETVSEDTAAIDLDDLTDSHKQYVLNLLAVDKRKIKDILVPWDSVTKIESSAHYTEVMELIRRTRHTRIPVLINGMPFGVLHAKEFISEVEISRLNWSELIRPINTIRPDETILGALKFLQSKRSHIAVIKKNETILGIVTVEDIIEDVVGDLYDEDDNPRVLLSSNSRLRNMNLPKR